MKAIGLSASVLAVTIVMTAGCVTVDRTERTTARQPATTVVTTSPDTAVVTTVNEPYCGGAYAPTTGTNFGACTSPPVRVAMATPATVTTTTTQPSAAVVTAQPGTTVVTTAPGTTVVTTPPGPAAVTTAPGTAVVTTTPSATILTTQPVCGGAYSPFTGTNFGACVAPAR